MPNRLVHSLLPAHSPCVHFGRACSEMRWDPANGHVPRGFCGGTGALKDVVLVLVTAEPGDPLPGEAHTGDTVASALTTSLECLREPATPFHKNIRVILDLCFPQMPFEQQLRHVWRTNSVLCSAKVECGPMSRAVERTCITTYLSEQLALIPHALVAALGVKARRRLLEHGIDAFSALHPSSRVSNAKKLKSWSALALALHQRHPTFYAAPSR